MAVHIDLLLRTLVIKKASDLHLQVGNPPYMRVHGEIVASDLEPLTQNDMEQFLRHVLSREQLVRFARDLHLDFSYSLPGIARFRVNAFRQRGCTGIVIRLIPWEIVSIDELKLPVITKQLVSFPTGLVLVTGPTGSGKSTTLAAMIDYINTERQGHHIITIEDPIEFLHQNKKCLLNQRELGQDTHSFADALRGALREDPDVLLVGELRDLETVALAVTAAETGHLVLATLHTSDASQTIDRIIDIFPPHQQSQIRLQVSLLLRGVVSQTLLRRKEGHGRVAAFEIMVVTPAIGNLIRDGKSPQIFSAIQTGVEFGMCTMDTYLRNLVKDGVVTPEEALSKSRRPSELQQKLLEDAAGGKATVE